MGFKQSLWRLLPPKVCQFFEDGPETVILSRMPPEDLLYRIYASFGETFSMSSGSAQGSVIGSTIRVRWQCPNLRDAFEPLFRGRVEAAEGGSRIVGYMSHNRFVQGFMAFWCGAILLFSLLTVWTVIMPLSGWGLLWLANGLFSYGDHFYPGRRECIMEHLRVCASRPFSDLPP